MKNNRIRFISLIMAAITVCTFAVTANACSGSSFGGDAIERLSYVGTHQINATDTDNYLVKDGKSDYIVIYPSKARETVVEAKSDFLILFKKATGVALNVKSDDSVNLDELGSQGKYISIGKTLLAETMIPESEYSEEKLTSEGVRIISKDNAIFILGGGDFGVSNAVYTFLEIYFNFDYYYRNCISIDSNVTDCKFKNLDVTDIPDIEHFSTQDTIYAYHRTLSPTDIEALGVETAAEETSYMDSRLRAHYASNTWMLPIHTKLDRSSPTATIHNALDYIPKGSEGSDVKMFSDGAQLCYSGHGDDAIVERMLELCAEKIIFTLKNYTLDKYPYSNCVSFTMEDNTDACACAACKSDYEEVGYSGQLIKFANRLGRKVQAWLDSQRDENAEYHNAYRENFKIYVFAYNMYVSPPVDESGSPINDEVICDENIGIYHVSSGSVKAASDIYDYNNGKVAAELKGWKTITQKSKALLWWHNSCNVSNNMYFSDALTVYNNNYYEAFASCGYQYMFYCHFYQKGGDATAWQNLLAYIQSKLRWDCHRDMEFYIRKYMKAMYHDAADSMYDLYFSEALYYTDIRSRHEDPLEHSWGRDLRSVENFPYQVLKGWVDKCDQAISELEYLKETDPALYKVVRQRIEIETAAHLYRIVDLYGNAAARPFNEMQLREYKRRMVEIGTLAPKLKCGDKYFYEMGV